MSFMKLKDNHLLILKYLIFKNLKCIFDCHDFYVSCVYSVARCFTVMVCCHTKVTYKITSETERKQKPSSYSLPWYNLLAGRNILSTKF